MQQKQFEQMLAKVVARLVAAAVWLHVQSSQPAGKRKQVQVADTTTAPLLKAILKQGHMQVLTAAFRGHASSVLPLLRSTMIILLSSPLHLPVAVLGGDTSFFLNFFKRSIPPRAGGVGARGARVFAACTAPWIQDGTYAIACE